jgi:hypothetical protein
MADCARSRCVAWHSAKLRKARVLTASAGRDWCGDHSPAQPAARGGAGRPGLSPNRTAPPWLASPIEVGPLRSHRRTLRAPCRLGRTG